MCFSAFSPLSTTVARVARHSHPSPPEKKAASRKKSRLRRKKTAPAANSRASSVSREVYPCRMDSRHNRPSEALHSGYAISKLRSASPSLAWSCPRYAISDGRFAGGSVPTCGFSPKPTLSKAHCFGCGLTLASSKLRSGCAFACMKKYPRYAISDGNACFT